MDGPEEAAATYRRFIMAWHEADPELQDRVEQARKRLQELTGSGDEPMTDLLAPRRRFLRHLQRRSR